MSKKLQKSEEYNIWNNPMVTSAKKNLSASDLKRYEALGKSLYGKVNYKNGSVATDSPPEAEALLYVEESLKSGLHPSMLEDEEKALLEHTYGKKWMSKWGYVKEDLTDIVTIKQ